MNPLNSKTRITTSVIGVLLGLSGIFNHGIFEILQGNTSTNGFFIEAIGIQHRFWVHGTEVAFTLIHNYLFTGIAVLIVGTSVVIWSMRFIQVKQGPSIFLFLLILLTLVGGGIGFLIVYLPTWAFATRINKSLDWWERILPTRLRNGLSVFWIYGLVATALSWLIVMELGIFGYFPGELDPDTILSIVFIFLFATVLLSILTFIAAFASDIKSNKVPVNFA